MRDTMEITPPPHINAASLTTHSSQPQRPFSVSSSSSHHPDMAMNDSLITHLAEAPNELRRGSEESLARIPVQHLTHRYDPARSITSPSHTRVISNTGTPRPPLLKQVTPRKSSIQTPIRLLPKVSSDPHHQHSTQQRQSAQRQQAAQLAAQQHTPQQLETAPQHQSAHLQQISQPQH
eukprot:GHVN01014335.1.p1 GENE.GHVN01014335.1~~GHVN01014335.1.p1  ORF type:complete len:178 (-),score=49.62 GHVN01014335.1:173-706(-)